MDFNDLEDNLCNVNPSLIEEILRDSMTTFWTGIAHKPFTLTEVDECSSEYDSIQSLFSQTSRGMTIKKLERIENPFLLGQYLLKKETLQQKHYDVTERSLFHGTRETCIENICKFNFDWRKRGSSTGHKFGQGVSFTPEVSYARHYTSDNVMFLAKVLVGKSTYGDRSTEIPPEPYDTTTNLPETVIVKYEDDDFYPQYAIHFKY